MRFHHLAVLAALVAAAGCNSGSATPAPSKDPGPTTTPAPVTGARPAAPDKAALQAQAEVNYKKLCAHCHADDGTGYRADHAPSLVNPTFLESASDEFLRRSILWGRPGTSMAAYGKALGGPLDDAAVTGLVEWMRAKGPKPKPLAAVGKGNATRGDAIYKKYCASCHGDARIRGEAPHLANPQFLAAATDAFIKHAIVVGRPSTKMLAFGTVLSDTEIDDTVAFIRELGGAAPKTELLPEPTQKEPLVLNPRGADPTWKVRENRFVSVDDVAAALKAGRRMIIVDARPPSEWRRVHIAGAVSIPYHDMHRLAEVPKGTWVITYCACPHHLSGIVVDELKKRGHDRAAILDEGINVWHQRNYPVTAAPGVTAPPLDPHAGHGHAGHDHSGHGH